MSLKIMVDSVSDIPREMVEELNIIMMPLSVNFGEESYRDFYEITSKEFYEKLKTSSVTPTTSQVTPGEFINRFEQEIGEGNEIIALLMSSKLSGTYGAAVTAKNHLESDQITVVDTENVTMATGLIAIEAAKMVKAGRSKTEVLDAVTHMKDKIETRLIFDTLEYLKRGGRLSGSQAMIGNLLNVKPIIAIEEGELQIIEKVRGRKRVIKSVISWLKEHDLSEKTLVIYDGEDEEYVAEMFAAIEKEIAFKEVIFSKVGAVVGTHGGPGCMGISFIG